MMDRRLSLVCDEDTVERIESLSHRYGIPKQEVLRQVIQVGLERIED